MKNKKFFKIIIVAVVILCLWLVLRFVIGGPEDTWICVDNEWVKHGAPGAPMPTESCGENNKIESFQECVEAGNPVMESYPRQCRANDEIFVENIGNELEKIDMIRIDHPRPNQEVVSPLVVRGEARGLWFFEGDFPVILTDWDGLIIAEGYATAKSDWMTENFVEFEGKLEFEKSQYSDRGTLILQKDNPSGLPENDDALEIPIVFK